MLKFNKCFFGHKDYPIISRYVSFHCRDIIWECKKCKRRIELRESSGFSYGFSKETDMLIDSKTYKSILNGSDYYRIGTMVFSK